jgi:hypothetical protein
MSPQGEDEQAIRTMDHSFIGLSVTIRAISISWPDRKSQPRCNVPHLMITALGIIYSEVIGLIKESKRRSSASLG